MGPAEENHVWLLKCNVSAKPRWMQLLICGGGFFFGYMINGVCEVRIMSFGYARVRLGVSVGKPQISQCSFSFLIFLFLVQA